MGHEAKRIIKEGSKWSEAYKKISPLANSLQLLPKPSPERSNISDYLVSLHRYASFHTLVSITSPAKDLIHEILSHAPIKWVKCLPGGTQNGCLKNGSRWSCDIKPNMVRDKFLNLRGLWGRWPGLH